MGHTNSKILTWCVLIMVGAGLLFSKLENRQYKPSVVYGKPTIYTEASPGKLSCVGQILECQDQIYIMDDEAGTVVVYNSDGIYIKTIAFCIPSFNGTFRMAVSGADLYVEDNLSNIYIFRNSSFVTFLERERAETILRQLDFSYSSDQYISSFGSIWKQTNEGKKCFVQSAYIVLDYKYLFVGLAGVSIVFIRKLSKKRRL